MDEAEEEIAYLRELEKKVMHFSMLSDPSKAREKMDEIVKYMPKDRFMRIMFPNAMRNTQTTNRRKPMTDIKELEKAISFIEQNDYDGKEEVLLAKAAHSYLALLKHKDALRGLVENHSARIEKVEIEPVYDIEGNQSGNRLLKPIITDIEAKQYNMLKDILKIMEEEYPDFVDSDFDINDRKPI